jgi:hypothetical protein
VPFTFPPDLIDTVVARLAAARADVAPRGIGDPVGPPDR